MPLILVTGATDGIGLETARQLLDRGSDVLVHGRNSVRANETVELLNREGHRGHARPVWADLARMCEVVELANRISADTERLDGLITNAGVYEAQRAVTEDGFERTWAVNHFAHHLLTRYLLPRLEAALAARIVIVSSGTHHSGHIDLDDLDGAKTWTPYGAYSNSKLANVLWARALAKRLARTRITVNALHPGVIGTKLLRAGFGSGGGNPSSGARTSVYLALDSAVAGITGQYFVDCQQTKTSTLAADTRLAEQLWAMTERLLAPFLPVS